MKDPPYTSDATGQYTFTRPLTEEELIKIACSLLKTKFDQNPIIKTPDDVTDYLKMELFKEERELFVCIFLDTKNMIIASEILFRGAINRNVIHPREVVKRCLALNATSIIIAHNHPSGNIQPSGDDLNLTKRMKEVLGLVEIQVLDHIIVAGGLSFSFKNEGLLV